MSRAEGSAAIPTWMIRDKSISRRAVLVYASLSSRGGLGAIYPTQATIAEESGVSERTARTALRELEELGVIERKIRRGREGRSTGLTTAYVLHPNGRIEEPATSAASLKGPATSDKGTGNSLQAVPLLEVSNQEVEEHAHSFSDFWVIWPKKNAKRDAERAWEKAVKKVSPDVIIAAARTLAESPYRPDLKFIPYGASWLNGERWTDPAPERSAVSGKPMPVERIREGMDMLDRLTASLEPRQRGIAS